MAATTFGLTSATVIAACLVVVARRPEAVIRGSGTVLAIIALISLAAVGAVVDVRSGGVRVRLDPSEEPMLPVGAPTRPIYAEAVLNFGDDDLYVVGMRTDGVFTHENLATLRRIGDAIRRLPGVRSVESLANTTAYDYDRARDLIDVSPLIDEIPTDGATLSRLRERATEDRIYPKTIVSRDGRTAAINVSFQTMTDGEFVAAGIDESILAIVAKATSPARQFFVTGRKHIKSQGYRLMVRDLLQLIPLAVVVGAVTAWILTGSIGTAVIPVGASLIGTLWVFGALAFLERPLNLITIVLGPMLICVGSVYGVHMLARYDDFQAQYEKAADVALACLRYTRGPVLIAGFTTCIGFSALALSDTPGIEDLGMVAALGVAAVMLISLAGLPALLARLPGLRTAGRARSRVLRVAVDPLLARIATTVTERPRSVLLAWGLVTIVATLLIPRIVVDTDYLTFFDRGSRVRLDFAAMSEQIVGAVPIYVTLAGREEGVFREPRNLRVVRKIQRRIDALPGVSATLSVVDLVEQLNRVVERDAPAAERIPDSRGEVADLLFLIPKNRLRRFANSNHSRVNILVRTGESGSAAILALERRLWGVIESVPLPPGIEPEVTGNAIVLNNAADGVARNQFTTVGAATLTILILVTRAFRSMRLGALAMIPNVVPVLLFFGSLGAGAARLSLPTSLIGCIALGIAIDDTAHFLVAYRHSRTDGLDHVGAVRTCIRRLGQPMVTTSVMLVAGFLVLSFSKFATLREFGYLSAVTMLACLAADLVLLPAVLVRARV